MILASAYLLGLHWVDWLVLLAYLIGVTFIGILSYRQVTPSRQSRLPPAAPC